MATPQKKAQCVDPNVPTYFENQGEGELFEDSSIDIIQLSTSIDGNTSISSLNSKALNRHILIYLCGRGEELTGIPL